VREKVVFSGMNDVWMYVQFGEVISAERSSFGRENACMILKIVSLSFNLFVFILLKRHNFMLIKALIET